MDFNNASNAYARGFDSDVWRPIGGLAGSVMDRSGTNSLYGNSVAANNLEMTFAGDRLTDYFNTLNAKANLEAYEEAAKDRGGSGSAGGGGGGIWGQVAGTAGAAIGTAIGGPVGGVIGGGLGNIVGGLFG